MSGPPRSVTALPKAHLHLHFTGSMRVETVREMASTHGIRLPHTLTRDYPPRFSATDARGWFRFQRLRPCHRHDHRLGFCIADKTFQHLHFTPVLLQERRKLSITFILVLLERLLLLLFPLLELADRVCRHVRNKQTQ